MDNSYNRNHRRQTVAHTLKWTHHNNHSLHSHERVRPVLALISCSERGKKTSFPHTKDVMIDLFNNVIGHIKIYEDF